MHLSAPSSTIQKLPPISKMEMKKLFHSEIVRAWQEMQNTIATTHKESSV
ncbi:MAG: hypothetical protein SWY16_16330 [Cyanobacteriota bacterium]|nr:hypothetical protein [Cyanobacteriota bacterium]